MLIENKRIRLLAAQRISASRCSTRRASVDERDAHVDTAIVTNNRRRVTRRVLNGNSRLSASEGDNDELVSRSASRERAPRFAERNDEEATSERHEPFDS
jgi:hypothetical protein